MTIWSKKDGHWKQVSGTSQADKSAIWGRISGSIRSQTDLIDILDTLQRDLNNVRAEYLDKFNLEEVQLIRSRTDFEREPLIRTVAPGDVDKDDGRHAVNCATMKRDAVMKAGDQTVIGVIDFKRLPFMPQVKPKEAIDNEMMSGANMASVAYLAGRTLTAGQGKMIPGAISVALVLGQRSCYEITDTDLTLNAIYVSAEAFYYAKCKNLKFTSKVIIESYAFANCKTVESLDMDIDEIKYKAFDTTAMKTLIMRNTELTVLSTASLFDGSPIESGTGFVYVPDELLRQYKQATNWVVVASQIKPLSALPAEASA